MADARPSNTEVITAALDHSKRLPAELKVMAIEKLMGTHKDLASPRLVNRAWGEASTPVFWRVLRSCACVCDDYGGKINALFSFETFLFAHVKEFEVLEHEGCLSEPPIHSNPDQNFTRILEALREDALTRFFTQHNLGNHQWEALLRTQTKIKNFDDAAFKSFENMQSFSVKIAYNETFYSQWFKHMPGLQKLCLRGVRNAEGDSALRVFLNPFQG
ncbi:hypothetical protein P154DRAFT_592040 [Amniculicola lignicola CBS 123094]|uniref:Uncharacterized protein n=1 Tax=Amniculicola lignicola CBS 123094 TaxID=1392246 RepID=A0A6A5WQM3_9PLEO|nr:hypothetical protein P154DRAFT_592040 [Amniculicola lignicola CBS 123094]